MSAPVTSPTVPPSAPAPTLGGLLRSELLRARSRRSLWWLTGLTLLAVVAVSVVGFAFSGAAGPDDLVAAKANYLADQQAYYDDCVSTLEPGQTAQEWCYLPTDQDASANAAYYLDPAPFVASDFSTLLGMAGGLATVVSLLVAASAGGADWGARSMGLLLSWEPRRIRVFLARLGVTLLIALVFSALAVGLAYLLGSFIANVHGWEGVADLNPDITQPVLGDMRELALRWVPVATLAAAAGYGVAMLTRSTGWAIGGLIAFGVVIGPMLIALWTWGSQWLPQVNVVAWLQGGTQWVVNGRLAYSSDTMGGPGYIWLSAGRAMMTLVAMGIALLVAAAASLRVRDVD